ncbi:MAG: glycosyltransferase family 4 protein [Desulfomicrobium sp.]|nr:glycosyltransferase family 4 protein [Desulfomicrobium sp.]
MRICILGPVAKESLLFRRDLILELVARGHTVFVFCADCNEETHQLIQSFGAQPVHYSLNRGGANPIADLRSLFQLQKLFKTIQPDMVLSCFVKPSIYGSIAAKLAGVPKRFAMLEGLGFVFTELPTGVSCKQAWLKKIQILLYRLALPYIDTLIFLNHDDPVDLLERNNLQAKHVEVLGGIGLDLKEYPYTAPPVHPVRFVFIARLLAEKGIFEYIEAAKQVKKHYPEAEFVVLGGLDEANPGGLKQERLQELIDSGVIIYPGYVSNVVEWIAGSSVFVLPSYYREGVPRSTQEAMAVGRAVITTDVPGCRETVVHGVNGFLVPKWNALALAEKMMYFMEHPEEITTMGLASHKLAVEKFDVRQVNERLIKILGL